jgi:hypothetical protein
MTVGATVPVAQGLQVELEALAPQAVLAVLVESVELVERQAPEPKVELAEPVVRALKVALGALAERALKEALVEPAELVESAELVEPVALVVRPILAS